VKFDGRPLEKRHTHSMWLSFLVLSSFPCPATHDVAGNKACSGLKHAKRFRCLRSPENIVNKMLSDFSHSLDIEHPFLSGRKTAGTSTDIHSFRPRC
jgi:hypothetical protein